MTKTTNYEISKKLAEIGFEAETHFSWIEECNFFRIENKNWIENIGIGFKELFPAYDLETLLDALPSTIEIENWGGWKYYNIYFKMNKNGLWYENLCNCDSSACPVEKYHYMEIIENESLADTAGRMIILLHEKNLIKF